jgi:hypothetical protein
MIRHTLSALSGVIVAIACAGPALAQTGQAATGQAGEDNMARCQQLFSLWARHNGTSSYGKVLDADMALEQCRKGQYSAGVSQLKEALQRQQIPVPPAASVAAQP